jgi:hypothetical protein
MVVTPGDPPNQSAPKKTEVAESSSPTLSVRPQQNVGTESAPTIYSNNVALESRVSG